MSRIDKCTPATAALAIVLASLVLTACGGSEGSTTASTSSPKTSASSHPAPTSGSKTSASSPPASVSASTAATPTAASTSKSDTERSGSIVGSPRKPSANKGVFSKFVACLHPNGVNGSNAELKAAQAKCLNALKAHR